MTTVAAFLGCPNKALLKAAGHISRYVDRRDLTDASHLELENIKTDPTLVKLTKQKRIALTIPDVPYMENKVQSTRAYPRKLAKVIILQGFSNTISTIE